MKKIIAISILVMSMLAAGCLSACNTSKEETKAEATTQIKMTEATEVSTEESVEQSSEQVSLPGEDTALKIDLQTREETELPLDQAFENDPNMPESSDGNGDKKELKEEIEEGKKVHDSAKDTKENLADVLKTNIYGDDNRHVIGKKYLTRFPNRAVVYIGVTYPNGQSYCGTGYMIGRNTIATAAHCIYSYADGGTPVEIRLYPGRKGDYKPYGLTYATEIIVPTAYVNLSRSSSYGYDSWMQRVDYGVIHVNNNLGDVVGWFGLRVYGDIKDKNKDYHMVGYYDGKLTTQQGKNMVYSSDNEYLQLYFDVMGGQSGSPIFYNKKGDRIVVGHLTSDNRQSNGGLAITNEIMQFYQYYKR